MSETFVQKQVRLVLERQCREIADKIKADAPAGTGFALFLFDYGEKGNMSYVSTVERESMIATIEEWLARQGRIVTPVTSKIRALTLRSVADALSSILFKINNPKVSAGATLQNVIAHLRRDAAELEATVTALPKESNDGS